MRALLAALLLTVPLSLAAVGCDDDGGTGGQADLSGTARDMTVFKSECGKPGDVGNSLGVGKFCTKVSDCSSNSKANLCSQLGDPNNYFCTFACTANGSVDQCGENARCACDPMGRGCGCFPTACDSPNPDL